MPDGNTEEKKDSTSPSCVGAVSSGTSALATSASGAARLPGNSSSSSSSDDDSVSSVSLPTPPDGGWGWVVVVASFIVHLIADGCAFSFGVLYVELLDAFQESKGKTAWVGSLFVSVPLITGPIASALTNKYGCRSTTIVGSAIASVGFIASSFATSIEQLCFTFGLVSGFGLSMVYVPAVVIVAYYFEKKRAFATGVAVAGSGIGTFLFAPLTEALIEEYTWKGAVLILGAIMLNMIVCGAVFRPLETKDRLRRKAAAAAAKQISLESRLSRRSSTSPSHEDPRFVGCGAAPAAGYSMSKRDVHMQSLLEEPVIHSLVQFPTYLQKEVRAASPDLLRDLLERKSDIGGSHSPNTADDEGCRKVTPDDQQQSHRSCDTLSLTDITDDIIAGPSRTNDTVLTGSTETDAGTTATEKTTSVDTNETNTNQEIPGRAMTRGEKEEGEEEEEAKDIRIQAFTPLLNGSVRANQSLETAVTQATDTAAGTSAVAVGLTANGSAHSYVVGGDSLSGHPSHRQGRYHAHHGNSDTLGSCGGRSRPSDMQAWPMRRKDIFYRGSLVRPGILLPQQTAAAVPGESRRAASCPDIVMHSGRSASGDLLTDGGCGPLQLIRFSREVKQVLSEMMDVAILRSVVFVYFCISSMLLYMWYDVPYVYCPDKAINMGVDEGLASFLISIIGITSTLGQIIVGFIGDRPGVDALLLYNVLTSVAGLSTMLVPLIKNYIGLSIYAGSYGFFISGNYALTTIILVELLGMEKLTNAYGLVMLAEGVANLIGPPLAGFISDYTGSYDETFYIAGAGILLSGLMLFAIPWLWRCNGGASKKSSDGDSSDKSFVSKDEVPSVAMPLTRSESDSMMVSQMETRV